MAADTRQSTPSSASKRQKAESISTPAAATPTPRGGTRSSATSRSSSRRGADATPTSESTDTDNHDTDDDNDDDDEYHADAPAGHRAAAAAAQGVAALDNGGGTAAQRAALARRESEATFIKVGDRLCQKLAADRSVEFARCQQVATAIAHELDKLDNSARRYKHTSLLHNLGANDELRRRVLEREISAARLVAMEPEEMATESERALREEVKEKSMKQAVLTDVGAAQIYCMTHKGVELVERPDINVVSAVPVVVSASDLTTTDAALADSDSAATDDKDDKDHVAGSGSSSSDNNVSSLAQDASPSSSSGGAQRLSSSSSGVKYLASPGVTSLRSSGSGGGGDDGDDLASSGGGRMLRQQSVLVHSRASEIELDRMIATADPLPLASAWQGCIEKSPNLEECHVKGLHVCGQMTMGGASLLPAGAGLPIKGRMNRDELLQYLNDLDQSNSCARAALFLQPSRPESTINYTAKIGRAHV